MGFLAHFFDVKGSQAYLLKNEHDLVVVCRGTEPTEFADIKSDLNAIPVPSSTGIGKVCPVDLAQEHYQYTQDQY